MKCSLIWFFAGFCLRRQILDAARLIAPDLTAAADTPVDGFRLCAAILAAAGLPDLETDVLLERAAAAMRALNLDSAVEQLMVGETI